MCNYCRREAINWLKELKQYRNNLNIIRKTPKSVWPETNLPFTDHTPSSNIRSRTQTHARTHTHTRPVMWSKVPESDRKHRWIPTILSEQAGLKLGVHFSIVIIPCIMFKTLMWPETLVSGYTALPYTAHRNTKRIRASWGSSSFWDLKWNWPLN